ncbi:MAG: CHAT domain-containing tetratricopeptide repeat protein [Bacteroidota bacterium]
MINRFLTLFILLILSSILYGQSWPDSLQSAIDKAFDLYDDQRDEEAITALLSSIEGAENALGTQNLDVANAWHNLGVLFYRLYRYDEAIEAYAQALKVREDNPETQPVDLIKSYHNIGAAYQYKGDYINAVEYLEGAISKNSDPLVSERRLIRSYREIARAYSKMGEHAKALGFYDSICAFYLESENYLSLASTYNDMASLYTRKDNGAKALEMSAKAIDFFDKIEEKSDRAYRSLANIYHNYALGYEVEENFQEALNAYEKSLDLYLKYAGSGSDLVAINHNNQGNVHRKNNQFKKALEHYSQAIELNEANNNSAALADNYHNLGELNVKQGNYANALEAYDKALALLTENDKANSKNTDAAPTGDKLGLLTNLSAKAVCHYQLFLAEGHVDELETALTVFEETDKVIDQLRQNYRFDVSKSQLTETMLPVFESSISACIAQYQVTRSPAYLETAFRYAEKSKAVALLEAITDSKAKSFVGLPAELKEQERQLKVDIAFQEEELRIEKSFSSPSPSAIKRISEKLIGLRQSYEALIARIEKEYPDYHLLKYNLETRSVPQIQSGLLQSGQGLIEYFVGADSLFVFYVNAKSFRVLTLETPPFLGKMVKDMREGISGFHLSATPTDIEYERLAKLYTVRASQLYQLLIGKLVDEGIDLPNDLVIIPDGVLNYLPFEALLTETAKGALSFSSMPYFINKHNVSYCYSATLLDEMVSKKVKGKSAGLLAMAPIFKGGSDLSPLESNTSEVEQIMTIWNGDMRLGDQATKSAFVDLAGNYRLLHLATHAEALSEDGDRSYLAFTQSGSEPLDARLLVKELYNLPLNADLVVLSACETGIGEFRRGEGLISLARGMSYAGATGIVTTLWKIDDAKTSELMANFYKYLKSGKSKSIALTEAKRKYITSNKDYDAHPFFWAAPVAIGDMGSIRLDLSPATNLGWYLGIGVLLVLAIGYFFRKKPKSKSV